MKILDYITNHPNASVAPFAAADHEAEVFPLRGDCDIVIVENAKIESLKHYEGYSMLIVSKYSFGYHYTNSNMSDAANVMIADKKDDLINAYCFLILRNVVSLNSSGTIPYEEVLTALELFKMEKHQDLSDRISWQKKEPIKLDQQNIGMEEEEEEQLGSIDTEYYKN